MRIPQNTPDPGNLDPWEFYHLPKDVQKRVINRCTSRMDRWQSSAVDNLPLVPLFILIWLFRSDLIPHSIVLCVLMVIGCLLAFIVYAVAAQRRYNRKLWETVKAFLAEMRCHSCDYCLAGTLAAGREQCPECGDAVTPDTTKRWRELTGTSA